MIQLLDFDYSIIDGIMKYVLWGTIALGVILFSILLVFAIKRIRYSLQMRSNHKQKQKILKAFDVKPQEPIFTQDDDKTSE